MPRPLINVDATFKSGWVVLEKWLDDVDTAVYQAIGTGVGTGTAPTSHADVLRNLGIRGADSVVNVFKHMTDAEIADVQALTTSVDVSTAIQAAIDEVIANGGGTVFFPFGAYWIGTTTLSLINDETTNISYINLVGERSRIDGDGFDGTFLQIGQSSATDFRAQHIVIEKLHFEGSGGTSSDSNQTAIEIWSALGVTLRDVYIQNIGGDALVIDKPGLGPTTGTAFNNNIVLDNVRIRFVGRRTLVVGESVVTDDLTITGACMFNNGGTTLTADGGASDGGVYIRTQTLFWFGGEVGGFNSDDGKFQYTNTVYLRSCAGIWSGTHFESNGNAKNSSYDILLDTDCDGLVINGLEFNEADGFTFVDGDVTVASDSITETSHGLSTENRVRLTSTGTLPGGLSATTEYYVIKVDANTIKLATSAANAVAGTPVTITSAAGGGNHRLSRNVPLGINCISNNVTIFGLQCSGARVFETIVNLNNSSKCMVGPIYANVAPATTYVNQNAAAQTALVFDQGYLKLPTKNASTSGGNVGTFTLDADASTDVTNDKVTTSSVIIITPTNAAAATLQAGSSAIHVGTKTAGTKFTVDTADAGNAAGTETFSYVIFN